MHTGSTRARLGNENICSMQNRPSQDPIDVVARAAMQDAATLIGLFANEFQSSYAGPDRTAYLERLAIWLSDCGAVVHNSSTGAIVDFDGRQVSILFGPGIGHR